MSSSSTNQGDVNQTLKAEEKTTKQTGTVGLKQTGTVGLKQTGTVGLKATGTAVTNTTPDIVN